MLIEFRPPTEEEILGLAPRLSSEDRTEILALGVRPGTALLHTAEISAEIYGGYADGQLEGVWGVCLSEDLAPVARPWFVASAEARRFGLHIMRQSRAAVAVWTPRYGYLENYVDARHTRAVTWLDRLGFTLEAPEPFGPYRRPFHRFHRSAEHVH